MSRWIWGLGVTCLTLIVLGGIGVWRYRAPVRVTLTSEVQGGPLEVVPRPAELDVAPGKMQRVVFKVTNPGSQPRRLKGSVVVTPAAATKQVEIFSMQCGDFTTVNPGESREFGVVFLVEPAGLSGQRALTLHHRFDRAGPNP